MSIKATIKTALDALGLRVHRTRYLPRGYDPVADLTRVPGGPGIETVLDVGANAGQSATRFARAFPGATVHSFEPSSAEFNQLSRNTAQLPNVRRVHTAMGAAPGTLELMLNAHSGKNSFVTAAAVAAAGVEEVPVDTIDAYCERERIARVDLLKIDVEGWEQEVLRGARGLLEAGAIRWVYLEATFDDADPIHGNFAAIREFLGGFGFKVAGVYEQEGPRDLTNLDFANVLFAGPAAGRAG